MSSILLDILEILSTQTDTSIGKEMTESQSRTNEKIYEKPESSQSR